MEIVLWIVGILLSVLLSALTSWLITDRYYKKSLRQQNEESSRQLSELMGLANNVDAANRQQIMQTRIEESIQEYRRRGTPVRVIDTYDDLSEEEKADLLDTVLLRVKGRKAKSNKYRSDQ